MQILITGSSGFIGFHLAKRLLEEGFNVTGIDNHNDYYDVGLKDARLAHLSSYSGYSFIKADITDRNALESFFKDLKYSCVFHLAAQAGVRYSLQHPEAYVHSNLRGFFEILDLCRQYQVPRFYFASSSSVYGNSNEVPYREDAVVDEPVSFYAATKRSNELMAYSYAQLYPMHIRGFRFFTVYGPYGRPDMAYFSFTRAIEEGSIIQLFNNGNLMRDFTYIDDVVEGLVGILKRDSAEIRTGGSYEIFNIGNHRPVPLGHFVFVLEKLLNKKAWVEYVPMQAGDVYATYADLTRIHAITGFQPKISIEEGLSRFVEWYRSYYKHLPIND
ncbi:UDP-glucuronate 4-epimerase [Algoriphagus boseongensis]|uniref:UDP-glucuronate 4-epimerase n=1 Tax=Algoriphagus boseongensis TaxID=1442587 RepID=A0A4R6T9E8_9BACT|nr:SDR family NAD(P)-dependent oxidoreductase [Algoriphagus boseongensis]TDQ19381.1 UDP-glucuronate 4-epimerase [Algoriphagus boseongensis]